MLKETYCNQFEGWGIPEDVHKIKVIRSNGSFLAPSMELLRDWQAERISWEKYGRGYSEMFSSLAAMATMKDIKKRSKDVNVYLICSCHNKENHLIKVYFNGYDKPALTEALFFHSGKTNDVWTGFS